jgi:acetyl-CoA carboxylase biotin carboxyl carrier protein
VDKEVLEDLVELMDKSGLTAIRITEGDRKIELERTVHALGGQGTPIMIDAVKRLFAHQGETGEGRVEVPDTAADSSTLIVSPMVGTFYTAPSPDEPPFVRVGQEITVGQTVAIVEAMKMMNEITTDVSGIIVEVLATNGQQVEYNQPLFRVAVS